jgi:DNA-binding transcriptional LysR family regulator
MDLRGKFACVAAGSGIAVIPHSVVQALHAESEVSILPLSKSYRDSGEIAPRPGGRGLHPSLAEADWRQRSGDGWD